MSVWTTTGEAPSGRYFHCTGGLIVREPGVPTMVRVIERESSCGCRRKPSDSETGATSHSQR
ncbi:hypothetical protein EYS09_09945 [Streptomyces kasugaensis]|uniref:Uncharacterized protein n=1 Tax=Streptomyces kasugaensis TaxID=1946 RepID=A0A4Q9HX93_STRKA|nr:hypothetical protein EYS09_09945 [Streptomyces kasugaensis]